MPSTNDRDHQQLQDECTQWLQSKGFIVASNEPHLRPELAALRTVETVAAHIIRTRADRVAIRGEVVVKWDAKTCKWTKGKQFAIEAVPYIGACVEGGNHVFVCRRKDRSEEFGIVAGKLALSYFDKILIPDWRRGGDPQWREQAEKWKSELSLNCAIMASDPSGGSGDMFVTINVDNFPHWKHVFESFMT